MILLPASLLINLPAEQLRAILAHEITHLKRNDHIVVVAQRLTEAILFFHPVTWWLSRRLDQQRELCCDDLVLSAGTRAVDY